VKNWFDKKYNHSFAEIMEKYLLKIILSQRQIRNISELESKYYDT